MEEEQASIKIPKILVDSRLHGISPVIMQSSDAHSIYSKDISKEVQNVFNQNGQNQMIQELNGKLTNGDKENMRRELHALGSALRAKE